MIHLWWTTLIATWVVHQINLKETNMSNKMPPTVITFLNTVSTRMHILNDERNKEDELTPDRFKRDLKEDWGHLYTNITIYPEWANNTVVGVDLTLLWGAWDGIITEEVKLRFITQNSNKRQSDNPELLSKYAAMAKEGIMITWIQLNGQFRGRIQNGKYIRNGEENDAKVETNIVTVGPHLHDIVMELSSRLPKVEEHSILQIVQACGEMGVFNEQS